MCGIILNDSVADLLELVDPVQDFHPNISHYDFLPPDFNLPKLSFFLVQYFIHHGPYGGRHLLAVNPGAGVSERSALLWGQLDTVDCPTPQ